MRKDNDKIESLAGEGDYILSVENVPSPVTLLTGDGSQDFINLAAAICARYSDAKHLPFGRGMCIFKRQKESF